MNTLEAVCEPKEGIVPKRWTAHSQMGTNLTFISVHFEAKHSQANRIKQLKPQANLLPARGVVHRYRDQQFHIETSCRLIARWTRNSTSLRSPDRAPRDDL